MRFSRPQLLPGLRSLDQGLVKNCSREFQDIRGNEAPFRPFLFPPVIILQGSYAEATKIAIEHNH